MDTAKALEACKNDYITAALEADSGAGLLRVASTLPVHMLMMAVLFSVTEPVVSGWKLKMFNSRTDALILRSLALLVNNSVKEGRELPDIGVLEACFNRVAQRCPSALTHMNRPDWAGARQRPHVSSVATSNRHSVLEETVSAGTPSPSAEPAQVNSSITDERIQVKPSTSARMRHAAENYGLEQLQATLSEAPNLVQFSDLDKAMQVAIDTFVRAICEGRSEEVRRYCGSTMISVYIVGRAMLGTVREGPSTTRTLCLRPTMSRV